MCYTSLARFCRVHSLVRVEPTLLLPLLFSFPLDLPFAALVLSLAVIIKPRRLAKGGYKKQYRIRQTVGSVIAYQTSPEEDF